MIELPDRTTTKTNIVALSAIVTMAIILRLFFLWVGRPVFVGWFNHTYYYYVETKGLLTAGRLPFPDMPLLFYLYAGTAKIITWLGASSDTAIVSATRFWMSIIPSLIPIPVFLTIRSINKQARLDILQWLLVGISAFLPLSLLHLPEFSQKNVVGLFLMAWFLFFTKIVLDHSRKRHIALLALTFIGIVLTHFGTLGAALLYATAILGAFVMTTRNKTAAFKLVGLILGSMALGLTVISFFDPKRYDRIFFYANQALESSYLGLFFAPDSDFTQRIFALVGVVLPLLIGCFLFLQWKKHQSSLSVADRRFWLSLVLYSYLLVLPVYDQLLLARLTLFISLPILYLIVFLLKNANWKSWLKKSLVAVALAGTVLLMFGEFMSLKMHNPNKEVIYEDLLRMQKQVNFGTNDLILTKNGAEHICNWFLGTKAGLITSLNQKDFQKYSAIYILNPTEGRVDDSEIVGKIADNEVDRYFFMMHTIPKPKDGITVFESEYMALFKIESPPEEWEFDEEGNWLSYGQ